MSQQPKIYGVYAYRKGCKTFPVMTHGTVILTEDIVVHDSLFGDQSFGIQFNGVGLKLWQQLVLQVLHGSASFSIWQGTEGNPTPVQVGQPTPVPDLPLKAGSVFLVTFKDDGTTLSGMFEIYDSKVGTVWSSGWLQFPIYDNLQVVSIHEVGMFAGSEATFSSGNFINFLAADPSVDDLAYLEFGYGDQGAITPPLPCNLMKLEQTQEGANLYYKITNQSPFGLVTKTTH